MDGAHLYSAVGEFTGEGAEVVAGGGSGARRTNRGGDARRIFSGKGILLTHALECFGEFENAQALREAMRERLPATIDADSTFV